MKLLFSIFLWTFSGLLMAHPVSLSWVRVSVEKDHLDIRYKILLEDLVLFHHPDHDGFYRYQTADLLELLPAHSELILKNFYITDDQGQRLNTRIMDINHRQLGEESIPLMDLMKYSLTFVLRTSIDPDWQQLTFYQEIASLDAGIPAVSIISVSRNGESMVKDREISQGMPLVLNSSGSSQPGDPSQMTSSYYTISKTGTRHELTIPASVLRDLMQSGNTQTDKLQEFILDYFSRTNRIKGNTKNLMPALSNIIYLEDQAPENSMIYLDLFYKSEEPLDSVRINWEDYNWKFKWMESEIYTIEGVHKHIFSRYQPVFLWKSGVGMETGR